MASAGDAQAQYGMCLLYQLGRAVQKDLGRAAEMCRLSAEQAILSPQDIFHPVLGTQGMVASQDQKAESDQAVHDGATSPEYLRPRKPKTGVAQAARPLLVRWPGPERSWRRDA